MGTGGREIVAVDSFGRRRTVTETQFDPHTGAVQVFDDGRFLPYTPHSRDLQLVESSMDHYAGRRGHLPCARVRQEIEHAA